MTVTKSLINHNSFNRLAQYSEKRNMKASVYDALDRFIRRGQINDARRALLKRVDNGVERHDRCRVGELLRRADCAMEGAVLLRPLVRDSGRRLASANAAEVAEYAACLSRIGASEEALEILENVDSTLVPRAHLYRAFALIADWRYDDAIAPLVRYSTVESGYQRNLALVNLAACHIFLKHKTQASSIIEKLESSLDPTEESRLLHNVRELKIQVAILNEDPRAGRELLKSLPPCEGEREALFIQKWGAILDLIEKGPVPSARDRLSQIKLTAERVGHFETVRQCDTFWAIYAQNERLLTHLYFGTPFEAFRQTLRPHLPEIPAHYRWRLGKPEGGAPEVSSDSISGLGRLLQRLLQSLSEDFYRPLRLASLFAKVYEGECFNPLVSPARIHVAISDLRKFFKAERLDLAIDCVNGSYRLSSPTGIIIQVPINRGLERSVWATLKSANLTLSTLEIASGLGVSKRTALRLIEAGLRSGQLGRVGSGSKVRYAVVDNSVADSRVAVKT